MKHIASFTATGLLVAVSAVGIAGGASADEPTYPPTIPPSIVTSTPPVSAPPATTPPATQTVRGVEKVSQPLADTGGGNTTVLLGSAAALVVVGGAALAYSRRRKGAHEA